MLTAGAITCRVYRLSEAPPPDFLEKAEADLRRHAFKPVNVDRAPRSFGWVRAQDVLDTDVRIENSMYDDYLVLGLRVDKVSVNARLVKAHFQRAAEERMRQTGRDRLGREEKAALLDRTRRELLAKQTPATSFYEAAWNTREHRVYFSATSENLNREFSDLFQDTFHVAILPQYPYLRAEAVAEARGLAEELARSKPEIFSPLARMHTQDWEDDGRDDARTDS